MRRLAFSFPLILLLSSAGVAQDSMNVRLVGVFDSPASDVVVRGAYAYLVGDSLFRVISVADPENPVEVGSVRTPGTRVTVQDGHAFVVSDSNRIRIVSVADPTNPVEVGRYDVRRAPQDIAASGDYAYVAAWDSGLRIISIADPTNPIEVAHIDTFGMTNSVAVSGDHAYVGAKRLEVVDVSDPAHPVTMGSCPITYNPAACVALNGYYAYALGWLSEHLVAIRVADPTHPVQVWQRDGAYGGVAVDGGLLYVGAKGVKVFSLADPGRPVEIGHYTISGTAGAAGIAADSEYAYVACSWAGLQIFQYYGAGVAEETMSNERGTMKDGPTIVRSILLLPEAPNHKPQVSSLLGASGRKVLDLRPGANDVSQLASGVYFIREPQAQAQAQTLTKVLVTR